MNPSCGLTCLAEADLRLRSLLVARLPLVFAVIACGVVEVTDAGSLANGISVCCSEGGLQPVGKTIQLTALVRNADGDVIPPREPVAWSVTSPTVATVSSAGLVRLVGAGRVAVTAQVRGRTSELSDTVHFEVLHPLLIGANPMPVIPRDAQMDFIVERSSQSPFTVSVNNMGTGNIWLVAVFSPARAASATGSPHCYVDHFQQPCTQSGVGTWRVRVTNYWGNSPVSQLVYSATQP